MGAMGGSLRSRQPEGSSIGRGGAARQGESGGQTVRQQQVAHKIEGFTLLGTDRVSPPTAREALSELVKLLDEYAPTWYTKEHRDRAISALRRPHKVASLRKL